MANWPLFQLPAGTQRRTLDEHYRLLPSVPHREMHRRRRPRVETTFRHLGRHPRQGRGDQDLRIRRRDQAPVFPRTYEQGDRGTAHPEQDVDVCGSVIQFTGEGRLREDQQWDGRGGVAAECGSG